jgi:hypothetical protein
LEDQASAGVGRDEAIVIFIATLTAIWLRTVAAGPVRERGRSLRSRRLPHACGSLKYVRHGQQHSRGFGQQAHRIFRVGRGKVSIVQ